MHNFYTRPSYVTRNSTLLSIMRVFLLAIFAFPQLVSSQSGLNSPQPIGKFLDGSLPSLTPGDGGNVTWSVEPAFTNLRFQDPLVITPHPTQNRLLVASRQGLIEQFVNDPNVSTKQVFLDLRDQTAVVWDAGFLGLALHPEFGQAGSPNRNYFYVYYTAKGLNGAHGPFGCGSGCFTCENDKNWYGSFLRLSRFEVTDGTLTVNPNTELIMINVRQFNGTHRGGGLVFGDDGFLYLTIGDQARHTTAQNIFSNFEGGVIRIDVDRKGGSISHAPRRKMGVHTGESDEYTGVGYFVPNSNPFLASDNSLFEEFVSLGHRAPHRMTKDRVTGEMWIGEVGQGSREEIGILQIGGNGGWPIYEGNRFRNIGNCGSNNLALGLGTYTPPVVDFQRSEANAIIGGYVYRGSRYPSLYGKYVCGGYSQNRIFTVEKNGTKNVLTSFSPGGLITFGEDQNGELYMGRQNSNTTLYTLQASGGNPPAPQFLSQTGAFKNLSTLEPEDGVIPYDMIEDFWSDNANKFRWLAIPNDGSHNTAAEKIQFSEEGNWGFPNGAVLIKHFELGGKRLETRFEVKGDDGQFYYLTYKWNAAGTDAEILNTGLDETITVNGQSQVWHYPSRTECVNCHQAAAGNTLGPKTRYLNKRITYPSTNITANQLVTLSSLGILDQSISESQAAGFLTMAEYDDTNESLEFRARSYIDLNCSYCHQPGTGNRAQFDARLTTPLNQQSLIYGPIIAPLDLTDPWTIVPQNVGRSMIHHRMNSLENGVAMPPLAKNVVDQAGVQLIADWINSLPPSDPPTADGEGTGLQATYYNNMNLTDVALQRIDPTVNFNWGTGSPDPTIDVNTFSTRWTGYIEAPFSGEFTFYTNSDDGVRLWVDDILIIDNWTDHAPTEDVGTIGLGVGQLVPIKLEWYENGGGAVMELRWSSALVPKQVVPMQYLYPELPPPDPISVSVTPNDATACGGLGSVNITYNRGTLEVRNAANQVVSDLNNLSGGSYSWTVTDGQDQESGNFYLSRSFEFPNVTGTNKTDVSQCGGSDGRITFTFEDNPDRSNLEFSIDGGTSYSLNVPVSGGSASINNLGAGTYDVWVRWGNDDCPVDLGSITLDSPTPPAVSIDPAGPFDEDAGIQSLSANPAGGTWGGASNSNGTFDPSVGPGTYTVTYSYTDANNCSGSDSRDIVVNAAGDTEAPSVPTGLVASNIGATSFTLTWNPSSDNVGVFAYLIYQNGSVDPIQIVPGTSVNISGLTANTAYQYAVAARDAAGNTSGQSQALQVTTLSGGGGDCTSPTNLALSGTSSQSTTYGIGVSDFAHDGSTTGSSPWTADLQHTNNENQPWWEIDLGTQAEIDEIVVWNRSDCCQNRLNSFYILISKVPFASGDLQAVLDQSGVNAFQMGTIPSPSISQAVNLEGRYVRIQLTGSAPLHMAEVQVMGCPSDGSDPCSTPPVVNITPVGPIAEDAGLQSLQASPSGGTWGGAANSSGQFDPSQGPGDYQVTYTYVDINGCSASDEITITVVPAGGECTTPSNVALNKVTSQSSTYGFGEASYAVDGSTTGSSPWSADLQHTTNESNPWWEVDLGSLYSVDQVQIWNRSDCCQNRLKSFYILVSALPFVSGDLPTVLAQTGVHAYEVNSIPNPSLLRTIGRDARYVRIQMNGSGTLHMAEVEVMGCPSDGSDPCSSPPSVSITPAGPFAEDAGLQTLQASPGGGTWGGAVGSNGLFDPSQGPGNYLVSYEYSDANGCIGTDEITVVVEPSGGDCANVTNLALNQPASQSSTYGFGEATVAVDGDTDGSRGPWGNASITHTNREDQPWWQVDLGASSQLDYITIFNRTDCCGNRLKDFYVLSSETPISGSATLNELLTDGNVNKEFFSGVAGPQETLSLGITGRYVRIQLSSQNILQLAEVQIFGCAPSNQRLELVGATEANAGWEVQAFPNPASGLLFIELDEPMAESHTWQVNLFDITGKELKKLRVQAGLHKLDMSQLPKGIYTLEVRGEDRSEIRRIQVQ